MERCATNKLQHKKGNMNTKHWKGRGSPSRSAGWNIHVPPVKAVWPEPPVHLLPTNHLARAWSSLSRKRPSVTELSNTCAGKSYTGPCMFNYVTARPHSCTTVQDSLQQPLQCGLRRAAEGWCSCAEGVPASRCAASAFAVLSSEKTQKADFSARLVPPDASRPPRLTGPRSLAVDSPHRSVRSKRLPELQRNYRFKSVFWRKQNTND